MLFAASLVVALAVDPPSTSITFNQTVYHVLFASPANTCFRPKDIHELTGTVTDAAGGRVAVHIANGTMDDYKIAFAPAIGKKDLRNFTSTYTCDGKTVHANGISSFCMRHVVL